MSILETQNRRIWIVMGLIAGLCLFVASLCYGSADPFLDGKIEVLDHKIGSWERDGRVVGWLIFLVFFIGLVVAALQAVTTWWMKILTGVLPVVSAALVGYYHQVFTADGRASSQAVPHARIRLLS